MVGEEIFVDLGPLMAQLEVVAGLVSSPPPVAAVQESIAGQLRDLVEGIAALPRIGDPPGDAAWIGICQGQTVEVFRDGLAISSVLGAGGELLWMDVHVEPGTHWHISFEGSFSGAGFPGISLSTGGGAAVHGTRMVVDVTTETGLVSSTQITMDGRQVDCLDVETGIDEALDLLRDSLEEVAGGAEDGEGEPAGTGEAPSLESVESRAPAGEGVFPGGAAGAAGLGGAAAGLAGAAAAVLRRGVQGAVSTGGRGNTHMPGKEAPGAPGPAPSWYYAVGDEGAGPIPLEELKNLLRAGSLPPGTLVWSPELADWQPASTVPALASVAGGAVSPGPPALPAAEPWYFAVEGQQGGPVSEIELKEYLASGRLLPGTLVWKPGMAQWVPAASLPHLWQ